MLNLSLLKDSKLLSKDAKKRLKEERCRIKQEKKRKKQLIKRLMLDNLPKTIFLEFESRL
jgi:hypothetical protein